MKVNILGTEYGFTPEDDTITNEDYDGICSIYTKVIKIKPVKALLEKEDDVEEKITRWKEITRHEIIHAFFFESGLEEQCYDEQIVDWVAKQFPKMQKVFEELGCDR